MCQDILWRIGLLGEDRTMMRPDRVHMLYLLLIAVFIIGLSAPTDLVIEERLMAAIISAGFAALWISILIWDRGDRKNPQQWEVRGY